jgi:hypothetical protein
VLQGFLASYLLLVKLDKQEAKGELGPAYKWVPMYYLHRWMRVTPAYAFAFFLHWKLAPLIAYGRSSPRERLVLIYIVWVQYSEFAGVEPTSLVMHASPVRHKVIWVRQEHD